MIRHFHVWCLLKLIVEYCHPIKSLQYDEHDVYKLKNMTYHDAERSCRLFGVQIPEDMSPNQISINSSLSGVFWVGRKMEFSRKINVVGTSNCGFGDVEEANDFSSCARICQNYNFFQFGPGEAQSCSCFQTFERTKDTFTSLKPCKTHNETLCVSNECAVYQNTNRNENMICDAITQSKESPGNYLYKLQSCTQKISGIVCSDGHLESLNNNITWFEAETRCENRNSTLLRQDIKTVKEINSPVPGLFWVSYFRRSYNKWGSGGIGNICVSMELSKGHIVRFRNQPCDTPLPVLCHNVSSPVMQELVVDFVALRAVLWILGVMLTAIMISIVIRRLCNRNVNGQTVRCKTGFTRRNRKGMNDIDERYCHSVNKSRCSGTCGKVTSKSEKEFSRGNGYDLATLTNHNNIQGPSHLDTCQSEANFLLCHQDVQKPNPPVESEYSMASAITSEVLDESYDHSLYIQSTKQIEDDVYDHCVTGK